MNFDKIDKELDYIQASLYCVFDELHKRDKVNKEYRKSKIIKRVLKKKTFNINKKTIIRTGIKRIFAVCHPGELHFALGFCRKCYWKQYRDNAAPATCHPNKKTFRRNLCKPCYRKLHPERRKND